MYLFAIGAFIRLVALFLNKHVAEPLNYMK